MALCVAVCGWGTPICVVCGLVVYSLQAEWKQKGGGGLTDLAVVSNGQTAGFFSDLSEKRPRGDWGLVLRF